MTDETRVLAEAHACDWPGCAGQCHTGTTCPCHPTATLETSDLRREMRSAFVDLGPRWRKVEVGVAEDAAQRVIDAHHCGITPMEELRRRQDALATPAPTEDATLDVERLDAEMVETAMHGGYVAELPPEVIAQRLRAALGKQR